MGFFCFWKGNFFGIGHAMLATASHRVPFPRWGGFKRKEYVLDRIFCNKGTLTNKFVGAFITKKLLRFTQELHILFSFAEGGGFEPPVP